ncbi:MAG: hypothetical protein WBV85_08065 [Solirubrobacteraceae bacterium]
MKAVIAMILLVALVSICSGCGGAHSVSEARSATSIERAIEGASSSAPVDIRSLRQDEDDDDGPGEEKGLDSKDPDIDGDNDNLKPLGYYDQDDGAIRGYGHAADVTDWRALRAFTVRYFAAAGAEDGARACSMLAVAVAKSVLNDYGRGSVGGPPYLRKGTTCAQVLTLLFRNLHRELKIPIEIIQVRVNGSKGRVFIGTKNTPASFLEVHRETDGWRSVGILATPLP